VLAIAYATLKGLGRADEGRRMEQDCQTIMGRKTYSTTGEFQPPPPDPVPRPVFPGVVRPAARRSRSASTGPG
jgi:hypothetical protein